MKRKTSTNKQVTRKTTAKPSRPVRDRLPIGDHLKEVKRRLMYVSLSIAVCSALIYGVERRLIDVLLRPSHGQHFVYTSPMSGINFLFNVCFYFGIALSMPVIIYNVLQFLRPLMRHTTQRFVVWTSISSGVIALCGILFGYFAGLPAALHFLLKQQFHSGQVDAMISIEKYFSFVVAYMFGAALMFQLPLLLIVVNHIRKLTPRQMFKYERAVILFAFVSAFIMNPTPNVVDQMLTVIPVLLSYQVGILLVWLINKANRRRRYSALFERDAAVREERVMRVRNAQPLLPPVPNSHAPSLSSVHPKKSAPTPLAATSAADTHSSSPAPHTGGRVTTRTYPPATRTPLYTSQALRQNHANPLSRPRHRVVQL